MFEIILVPLDGSELAEAALTPALELREKFGSRLILVRSVEPISHLLMQPPTVFDTGAAAAANVELLEKALAAERAEAERYLDGIRARLAPGGPVEAIAAEGDPAEAVIRTAAERGAGLIIMSSHGRGGLGRLVFGSVADAVLRRSTVPVLLTRSA